MEDVTHKNVQLSTGITMHYAQVSPLTSNGHVVVFVHGFPELWVSWLDQMRHVANLGFTAIAPDMRGYGETSAPSEVEAYHLKHLTADLCALLTDHLDVEKAVFVGHDWGGFVVWAMAFHHESRCIGVASLNTPVSMWEKLRSTWELNECKGPMEFLARLPSEECGEVDYQVYFNQRDTPEKELEADVERTIHAYFRSQLPSRSREENLRNMKLGVRTAKVRKDNNRGVLFHCGRHVPRDPLWSEEEMNTYITAFQKKGFFGPLCWYRNIDANVQWDKESGCAPGELDCKVVQIPCLMVTAEFDLVLSPESSVGMEAHFARLTRGHVRCGHWVQREQTQEINRILSNWLTDVVFDPAAFAKL